MLLIGKITRPHGIRGEVKVQCYTDEPSSLKNIPLVTVKGIEYAVESVKFTGDFAVLKLKGIDDANQAELLRNSDVYAQRKDMPSLGEGRHYIVDLLGCDVTLDGVRIGTLTDIIQNTGTDVYDVKGERNVMFPVIKDLIRTIDIENKRIDLDGKRFKSVAVYED